MKAGCVVALLITGLETDTAAALKNARDIGFSGPIVEELRGRHDRFVPRDSPEVRGGGGDDGAKGSCRATFPPQIFEKGSARSQREYAAKVGSYNPVCRPHMGFGASVARRLKRVDPTSILGKGGILAKIRCQIRDVLSIYQQDFVGHVMGRLSTTHPIITMAWTGLLCAHSQVKRASGGLYKGDEVRRQLRLTSVGIASCALK